MKWDKKLWITADIFNKAVCANIPNPLKNLCTQFDMNTLRYCGEMAYIRLETLTSLWLVCFVFQVAQQRNGIAGEPFSLHRRRNRSGWSGHGRTILSQS